MPDEVTLDVTTIEENVTVETTAGDVVEIQVVAPAGPAGDTGPAGPNSVTSATTSDGTANLSLGDLEVVGGEIYTDGEYSHIYTQGDGAEIFTIGTDAIIYTQGADAHISTSGDSATIYTSGASGSIYTTGANAGISTVGANATMGTQGTNATISTAGSAAHIQTSHASAAVKSTNFAAVESGGASLVDGSMQPCLTWSAGGRNLTIPSGTATTFNTTSYTYGTGAAAAHRTALGLTTLATTTPAANVATFLETPSSANLAAAVTGETGTGALVFGTSPTIDAPTISGSAAFTSTTRPTSAGTGTPAATSLITLTDADTRFGGPIYTSFLANNTSYTNDATGTTILSVTLPAGTYQIEAFARFGANAANSKITPAITVGSSELWTGYRENYNNGASPSRIAGSNTGSTSGGPWGATSNSDNHGRYGTLKLSATATYSIIASQNTTSATTTTVTAGAYIIARKIA